MKHLTLLVTLLSAFALQSATASITVKINNGPAITADNLGEAINKAVQTKDIANKNAVSTLQITSGTLTGTSKGLPDGWFEATGDWASIRSLKALESLSIDGSVTMDSIPGYMFAASKNPVYNSQLKSLSVSAATRIGEGAFNHGQLNEMTLSVVPPTVGKKAFAGCPSDRTLTLVDRDGMKLAGSALADAVAKYSAVDDGNTNDNLWYGWKLPKVEKAAQAVASTLKAWLGSEGQVHISTTVAEPVYISTISGALQQLPALVGERTVTLPSGNYIIRSGQNTAKIQVK